MTVPYREKLPAPSAPSLPAPPWLNYAAWALVAVGVVLRVARYLADRSLWLDESMLALNIAGRSFGGLTHPLAYNQGAPLGFLMLEKCSVLLLGVNEYALRLVPLIAGVGSLFLFLAVARRCLRPEGAVAALSLFVVSEPLIYYSSETKQYSTDLLMCLWIVWAGLGVVARKQDRASTVRLGVAGAVGVWFSHAAVFVMAGTALMLLLIRLREKDRGTVRGLIFALAAFGLSFGLDYLLFLRPIGQNHVLLDYWQNAFAPEPLRSWRGIRHDGRWALTTAWGQFQDPLTVGLPILAGWVALVGVFGLARDNVRALLLLLSPIAVALLAACLHKYPFQGRLILFLVPLFQLLIAAGLQTVVGQETDGRRWVRVAAGAGLLAALAVPPAHAAAHALRHPPGHEELRTVLKYVSRHSHPKDMIYVYYGAAPAFDFYAHEGTHLRLPTTPAVMGIASRGDPGRYARDLHQLAGCPRVWIVFSHVWAAGAGDEEAFMLRQLDRMGTERERATAPGAAAYLYDLRPLGAARPSGGLSHG